MWFPSESHPKPPICVPSSPRCCSEVEFWMGKPSRLHDRVVYKRSDDNQTDWLINRLSP